MSPLEHRTSCAPGQQQTPNIPANHRDEQSVGVTLTMTGGTQFTGPCDPRPEPDRRTPTATARASSNATLADPPARRHLII